MVTQPDDVEAVGGAAGHVLVRHLLPSAFRGLVLRITGYRETRRGAIRMTETAGLVVPVVVSFGEPFAIALGRAPGEGDRIGSFTAGLTSGPAMILSNGGAHCLQIDFTPLGACRFFARPMEALAERMVPLDALSDPTLAGLRERLGAERSWHRRFAIAEAAILPRLLGPGGPSRAVAHAYGRITATGGVVRVAALAAELSWSRKHLAARFRQELGLTPKTVARIARFGRAQAMAASGTASGWADVAAACGYADQAHLVREYAALAGATPGAWPVAG
jgi:AraC-like DNA-binding protein